MMMRSGFSMNRDITPSSPHPLSKVADTATAATKNPRIMLLAIRKRRERSNVTTSTLSCVPINCEPALTVVRDQPSWPGPLRDGADHAWRERPLRRRAHPQCRRADEPRRPVRAALWANGAADFVHDPGIALHEDLWPDARATGDGLGRAARMGGEEPARHRRRLRLRRSSRPSASFDFVEQRRRRSGHGRRLDDQPRALRSVDDAVERQ